MTIPAELETTVIPQSRQSKPEKTSQDESVTQLSDPSGVSAPNTSTAAATSANVCKVRPQKQPTNAVITSSPTAPVAHTSKPELSSFPMSTAYSTPGNTVLINTSQLRRPIGDAGDWLGKTPGVYTSNSSSVFFDGYGSKKLETAPDSSLGLAPAATAAAAMYLQQHQQQPFRQTLHPLQQQQPMMGFGLPDLTMVHFQLYVKFAPLFCISCRSNLLLLNVSLDNSFKISYRHEFYVGANKCLNVSVLAASK